MPPPLEVPVGREYGRLTVIGLSAERPNGQRAWDCRCSCDGKVVAVTVHNLLHAGTKSCGCTLAERRENALDRKARALPGSRDCAICGQPYKPARINQFACSEDCRRENHRRWWLRKRRRALERRPLKSCVICGDPFFPTKKTAKVCPEPACRAQYKRDLANALTRGRAAAGSVERTCVVCDGPFLGHANSLVCGRACRLARNNELLRRRKGSVPPRCLVCATELPIQGGTLFTCPGPCREVARKRRNRRGYERHPERREKQAAAHRRRMETDPVYRAHVAERDRGRLRRKNLSAFLGEVEVVRELIETRAETHAENE